MSLSSNPNTFAGGERKEAGGDSSLKTLLDVNNLNSYVLPSAISVTVARSHKQSYAAATEFRTDGLNTMTFLFTPGSDYVWGRDSYITCKLEVVGTPVFDLADSGLTFGKAGNIFNLFKSVRLTHASGTEIEFQNNANLLSMHKRHYDQTHASRQCIDSVTLGGEFQNEIGEQQLQYIWTPAATGAVDVTIPLWMLSDFFNTDKLIPPYALAGMRLEIELEDPKVALEGRLVASPWTLTEFKSGAMDLKISQCRVQSDSHTLTDSVQKALARMSANEGIDLHFPSYFHDRHSAVSGSTTLNISKALSRVEDIFLIPRVAAKLEAKTIQESFKADTYDTATRWQIAIGSMFFPSHEVSNMQQSYMLAQQGKDLDNRITLEDFRAEGHACLRGAMERSQILNGSGIAISATRGATIQYTNSVQTTIDLFVKHTRLVSVFLDNVVVRT